MCVCVRRNNVVFRKLLSGKIVSITVAALPLLNAVDGSGAPSGVYNMYSAAAAGGGRTTNPQQVRVNRDQPPRRGGGPGSRVERAKAICRRRERCVFPPRPRSTLAQSQWINLKFSTSPQVAHNACYLFTCLRAHRYIQAI